MLLQVDNIWAGYGEASILQGTNLSIEAGELVGILGPNGVGKTTLMRTLAGSLDCKKGTIAFSNLDITQMPAYERASSGIGYVPQGREIFPQLTVMENLLVGVYAMKRPKSRVGEIVEHFPSLKPKLKALGGSLSGGQQQLLALARALIIEPKLLLLDEPSEGIQPSLLDEISDVIGLFQKEFNLAILLVEQNLDFAGQLIERAYVMEGGLIKRSLDKENLSNSEALHQEFLGVS